jgi:hypothetical protein
MNYLAFGKRRRIVTGEGFSVGQCSCTAEKFAFLEGSAPALPKNVGLPKNLRFWRAALLRCRKMSVVQEHDPPVNNQNYGSVGACPRRKKQLSPVKGDATKFVV